MSSNCLYFFSENLITSDLILQIKLSCFLALPQKSFNYKGNDHEVKFHEIKIAIFHEIEITIMRSKIVFVHEI